MYDRALLSSSTSISGINVAFASEHKEWVHLLKQMQEVIENMHKLIKASYQRDMVEQGYSEAPIFDSTRGAFYEGGPAFTGAGISKKSHIQVCIRNRNCIKGFFIPRTEIEFTG